MRVSKTKSKFAQFLKKTKGFPDFLFLHEIFAQTLVPMLQACPSFNLLGSRPTTKCAHQLPRQKRQKIVMKETFVESLPIVLREASPKNTAKFGTWLGSQTLKLNYPSLRRLGKGNSRKKVTFAPFFLPF